MDGPIWRQKIKANDLTITTWNVRTLKKKERLTKNKMNGMHREGSCCNERSWKTKTPNRDEWKRIAYDRRERMASPKLPSAFPSGKSQYSF